MDTRRGFTLTELLVVIGIMLLLMGLGFPAFNLIRKRAQHANAKALVHLVAMAAQSYGVTIINSVDPLTGAATGYRPWDWNQDRILDGRPTRDEAPPSSRAAAAMALEASGYQGFLDYTRTEIPKGGWDVDGHVIDPWKTPLRIVWSAERFGADRVGVWSSGPDRIDQDGVESSDDVVSWGR